MTGQDKPVIGDDDAGFQRVGDLVADRVRDSILGFIEAAGPHADAQQAVCLGALAGVVQAWAVVNDGHSTEPRMIEAMSGAVADFMAQAYADRRRSAS